jgi:hypothetical protein
MHCVQYDQLVTADNFEMTTAVTLQHENACDIKSQKLNKGLGQDFQTMLKSLIAVFEDDSTTLARQFSSHNKRCCLTWVQASKCRVHAH